MQSIEMHNDVKTVRNCCIAAFSYWLKHITEHVFSIKHIIFENQLIFFIF